MTTDFFVVLTSWVNVLVDFTGIVLPFSMSTMRSLRILRVLKAFKKIDGIRQILGTIGQALPHSANVIAFLGFLLTISGIIGVQMFRGLTRNRCEYTAMDLQAQRLVIPQVLIRMARLALQKSHHLIRLCSDT